MKIYKNVLQNHILFLVNDINLPSGYPFRNNINKILTIQDQIRDGKLQYDINREAAKISALSSGKSMNILLVKKYYLLINNK